MMVEICFSMFFAKKAERGRKTKKFDAKFSKKVLSLHQNAGRVFSVVKTQFYIQKAVKHCKFGSFWLYRVASRISYVMYANLAILATA